MIKLFSQLKLYRRSIILVLITTFIYAIIYLSLPKFMGEIVDNGVVNGNINYIFQVGAIMIVMALLGAALSGVSTYVSTKVACAFGRDIRRKLFVKAENLSINEFDKLGTDSLITRTTNDVTQVQQVLNSIFKTVVFAPMLCIGGVIMIASDGGSIQWILWAAIVGLLIYTTVVLCNLLPIYEKIQVMIDKLNSVLREGLIGVRVIRGFNRTSFHRKRFEETSHNLVNIDLKANRIDATVIPVIAIIMNFTTLAILWYGGIEIDRNKMQIGSVLAFIQYAMQILASVIMVAATFVQIPRAMTSSKRINEVLEIEPEIGNPQNPVKVNDKKGTVEFKNVFYKYKGANEAAIENVSFLAEPGEITAIIGGTGSGKSTILNLVTRFYDVTSGSILVDGIDIRQMTQEDLRSKLGLVPQKSLLFTGTVSENIRYGKDDATNEEVKQAATIAQAKEFITSMSEGFGSEILKGGANVSGGQRQRLAIARALVKNPEIYLFDDCFSALDFKTDRELRTALKKEVAKKAVIIVSQRVSTIMNADKIIVIDDGKVAGIGKHRELLENCQVYSEIVQSQFLEEAIV